MEAGNRANTHIQQSLYQLHQQAGYPPEVMSQFLTPEAYQAHVAWPEVRPNAFGGDGARGMDDKAEGEEAQGYGSNEDLDDDDLTQVFSANTSRSKDDNGSGSDYMED
jgi:hypothetical protein